jgi:hypothetical protein
VCTFVDFQRNRNTAFIVGWCCESYSWLIRVVGSTGIICGHYHRNRHVTSIAVVIVRWSKEHSYQQHPAISFGPGRFDNVRQRRHYLRRGRRRLLVVHLLLVVLWVVGTRAGPVSSPITTSFPITNEGCRSNSSITTRHFR